MKIVLATGIYPPDIGGPATYVRVLAQTLKVQGQDVTVLSYGRESLQSIDDGLPVIRVDKRLPIIRWWRYARALKSCGSDADIVYAFSSVSVGVPLMISGLKRPRRVLRLGGDFFWERYTDRGGRMSLKQWYMSSRSLLARWLMRLLLRTFDHIVFSTSFQQSIYSSAYHALPAYSVIENALSARTPLRHRLHQPVQLLSIGRFVGFKNLESLVTAMTHLPEMTLALVGEGPMEGALRQLVQRLSITQRVRFLPPVRGEEKWRVFENHDILVIPSVTEISPNTALEARSSGLPVLLSIETGLSSTLADGMMLASLKKPDDIVSAIRTMIAGYDHCSVLAARSLFARDWDTLVGEHLSLFHSFL